MEPASEERLIGCDGAGRLFRRDRRKFLLTRCLLSRVRIHSNSEEVKFESTTGSSTRRPFQYARANREAVQSQGQAARIEFKWRPDRVIVWEGYREAADRTAASEEVEVGIWEAGADPDGMILGLSFVTAKRIVMNTVHIAHPVGRDESTIAKGLVVRTYLAAK